MTEADGTLAQVDVEALLDKIAPREREEVGAARGLVVRVGAEPKARWFSAEQTRFQDDVQRALDGTHDTYPLKIDRLSEVVVYVNVVAEQPGLPPNRIVGAQSFHGTMVLCRRGGAGTPLDVTNAMLARLTKRFALSAGAP